MRWVVRGMILSLVWLGSCASLEDRCLAKTNRMDVDPDLRQEYFRQCVENRRAAVRNSLR